MASECEVCHAELHAQESERCTICVHDQKWPNKAARDVPLILQLEDGRSISLTEIESIQPQAALQIHMSSGQTHDVQVPTDKAKQVSGELVRAAVRARLFTELFKITGNLEEARAAAWRTMPEPVIAAEPTAAEPTEVSP